MKYIIDTHALIWVLEANPRLGAQAKQVFDDPTSQLVLPAIALAEAVWIVDRRKTALRSSADVLSAISQDPRITIYPLDEEVIKQTVQLLDIHEMHDRQIVATGIVLQNQGESVALLTCDGNITAANPLPILW
jgi:PIN domain nuclease of toxin-antitoxin system